MVDWTEAEAAAARRLIDLALAEDFGSSGDVTSQVTIPIDSSGQASFIARKPGVVAGLPVVSLVCAAIDPSLRFAPAVVDGSTVAAGESFAALHGRMRSILAAERTALNFLQRLSGIATLTRRY